MSGDPNQDFFADGITEQIITELARFRDLSVISRNSTFSYKGKAVDVRQVGKELGARYVIEGSVQRIEDVVRVTVQLLDARTGAHLWAESYERDLTRTKVFGIQDDITERVVTAIGDSYGAISRATFEESKGKGTESLDAYECVLRYYAYLRVITPIEHARVRDCLERSVKLAPTYVDAWAALSEIYSEEYSQGFNLRPDPLERALSTAQRAVELDPANPRAYWALGNAQFFLHDIDAFTAAAERAVALNPNNVDVLAFYGLLWTYAHVGDPVQRTRGVEAMKKAIALSPVYPTWYHFPIAWHYYWNDEYEAALAEAKKVELPGYFWTHALLVTVYGAMDRKEDARAAVTRLLELYPEFPRKSREEFRKWGWNTPDPMIDRLLRDMRRAGLDIPEGG
jgi:TolB-like protein